MWKFEPKNYRLKEFSEREVRFKWKKNMQETKMKGFISSVKLKQKNLTKFNKHFYELKSLNKAFLEGFLSKFFKNYREVNFKKLQWK